MKTKLAGHTLLQDAIARTIDEARQKMKLAAEEKDEKEKVKKLVDYEKKEHGKVPSPKEESEECKDKGKAASVIDITDPDEVEKLASALEELDKVADYHDIGKESPQGGSVLPVQSPQSGTQKYKHDKSKKHNIPTNSGFETPKDNPGAKNAVPTDEKNAPYLHQTYPAKGPLHKGASVQVLKGVVEKVAKATKTKEAAKVPGGFRGVFRPIMAKKAAAKSLFRPILGKGKKASAVEYILSKIAEPKGGGDMPGQYPSEEGPKPPAAPGRKFLQSNSGPAKLNKRVAREPLKKQLHEVLTEPAMSAAHDSKIKENLPKANAGNIAKISSDLRSTAKGGVKTAAARALLEKVAKEGCTCDGAGKCRYCKMKKASVSMTASGGEAA